MYAQKVNQERKKSREEYWRQNEMPPITLPSPSSGSHSRKNLKSVNELIDSLNKKQGAHGVLYSYVPSSKNDGTGEIWIQRAPSKTNPNEKRTGKEFAPIRIALDSTELEGHHGRHTVLNVRGKMITDEYEYNAMNPNADPNATRLNSKDFIRRTSWDVLEGILEKSIGDVDPEKTRKEFGLRFGYQTDSYGSIGTRMSFQAMKARNDNRLNAIANTVSFRMPGSWDQQDAQSQSAFSRLMENIGRRTGFIGGTSGIIGASGAVRSESSMIPVQDLVGTTNVRQVTHFGYAAARFDPKTGKWSGPVDTGRVTTDRGQTYQGGYAKPADDPGVRTKEVKRASLIERQAYMPDANQPFPTDRFVSGGKERMNEIVVIARQGDNVGAGGSISSRSYLGLRTFEPEVEQEAYLPKGFQLRDAAFLGRARSGNLSQSGGAILSDQDLMANGGRVIKVDRVGLAGVQIINGKIKREKTDATGKVVLDPATNQPVLEDFEAPEFRISFGYDSDTLRMVRDFGLTNRSGTAYTDDDLRKIFSPETINAMPGGKWRRGITKKEKEYYAEFQSITKEITRRIQEQNKGVIVSLDRDQGGSTSGRTSIRWTQRKELNSVGGKGGSTKQTTRYSGLPDNPEAGGEVDRYLPIAQQRMARSVIGNRAMERIVYERDRKGNFVHTAPDPAQADEIDPATGLYKYRVMRSMNGREMIQAAQRIERIASRERREASRNLAALRQSSSAVAGFKVGDDVRVSTGSGPDQTGIIDQIGKRIETVHSVTKGKKLKTTTRIVDDPDYATVRVRTGNMIPYTDAKGNFVIDPGTGRVLMVPEERTESFRISNDPRQAQVFRTDKDADIAVQEQRLKRAQGAARNMSNLGSDKNPFGRWAQNRNRLNAENINSEFLEEYVGPISTLMSAGEQKTEGLFQQEVLAGIFNTTDQRFAAARNVVRSIFGQNDGDDINIWQSSLDADRLNNAMREVLKVAPRAFKRGEHPLYQDVSNPNRNDYYEAGLYAPHFASGQWDLNDPAQNIGRVSLVRATQGKSPEYTGLGRMTGEMMRMLSAATPQLYQDIANQQEGRAHSLQILTADLAKTSIALTHEDTLPFAGQEADDQERFEEALEVWQDKLKKSGYSNSTAIDLPALPGESAPYRVAGMNAFIGQERSAIGRAYMNLLEVSTRQGAQVSEVKKARYIYESERETFFAQQESVKGAMSLDSGLITGFSRYVSDSSVADNEIVVGDETVSLFAEQATRMSGFTVTKEDVIKSLQEGDGMYGFAPRMPEVTGFVTPFKFRYDPKNKSVPMVSEYFSMLYMGDNDADPLMMMVMGAFRKDAVTGEVRYGNFSQVKELHDKAPAGYVQALARVQSGTDPAVFADKFDTARKTAEEIVNYKLDNGLYVETDEQGRPSTERQDRLLAARLAFRAGTSGQQEYNDLVNKTTMEGLLRGESVRGADGNPIKLKRGSGSVELKIDPLEVKTGAIYDRRGKEIQKGKSQNIEKDRLEDLAKGAPNKFAEIMTKVAVHTFGAEQMADVINTEANQKKGMGVYTYLMSMSTFFDNEQKNAIRGAVAIEDLNRIDRFASAADRAKNGLGQYAEWSSLAREGILYEYQRAIDMSNADPLMERASKDFFTTDVVEWNKNRSSIIGNAIGAFVRNSNMNALTAASLLGQDEDSIRSIYKDIQIYRAGQFAEGGSAEATAASDAFRRITLATQDAKNSPYMRAMRGRVLINTQNNINTGWYEQNKTVAERRDIQQAYNQFLKNNKTAAGEAERISPLSRMMDTGAALASAARSFMRPILEAQGVDMSGVDSGAVDLPTLFRKMLGGKGVRQMSMKPGPADFKDQTNKSSVNANGITATPRNTAGQGVNSSYRFSGDKVTGRTAEKITRLLGGNKQQGSSFTAEELEFLPISPSQVSYLANPEGEADELKKSRGATLEGNSGLSVSGFGLVNQVISGMFSGEIGEGSGSFDYGRGLYTTGVAAFDRGGFLENAVFEEAAAFGHDPTQTIGYRAKGRVRNNFFAGEKQGNNLVDAGTVLYEPDLLVEIKDASGNTTGWQIKDIKTTSSLDYIKEEGMMEDDKLPGGYLTQQLFYTQAINEMAEGVRDKVIKNNLFGKAGTTLGNYMLGLADKSITDKNADKYVLDYAQQYKKIHEWFMNNGLTADEAHKKMESLIATGVEAGGLRFNVTDKNKNITRVNGEIELQDYDQVFGAESGFAKLRAMSPEARKALTRKIMKSASDNRLVRVAESLPQAIVLTQEANKRWNRDRAEIKDELRTGFNPTPGAPASKKQKAPVVSEEKIGLISRELAATLPYLRTADKEGKKGKGFVTASGLVKSEERFAKYGILDVDDISTLSSITGQTYKTKDDEMEARIGFRKLVGAAVRQSKTGNNPGGDPNITDAWYVERSGYIADFMGGVNREQSLNKLISTGIINSQDATVFKTNGGSLASGGTLADAPDVTARQLHEILKTRYGNKGGELMDGGGRALINPKYMDPTNMNGEDQKKQQSYTGKLRQLLHTLLQIPEGRQGVIRGQERSGGAAQVVNDKGEVIGSAAEASGKENTVEGLMGMVRAGQISGVTREDYSNILIPTFAQFNPDVSQVTTNAQLDTIRNMMQNALSEINPELADRFAVAAATDLPAMMQEAFNSIGTREEYESGAGMSVSYDDAIAGFNTSARTMQTVEMNSFYSGLSDKRILNYIPPEIGANGEVAFRSEPIVPVSASAASAAPAASNVSQGTATAAPATGSAITTGAAGGGAAAGSSAAPAARSAVDQGTGRIDTSGLSGIGVSLSASERAVIAKHNAFLDAKGKRKNKYKLDATEQALHDKVVKRITAAERKAATTNQQTVHSGAPAPATAPSIPAQTQGGVNATNTIPRQATIGADDELRVDRFNSDSDSIFGYLSKFSESVVNGKAVYSSGPSANEVLQMLQVNDNKSRIGMGEVNLIDNLQRVFKALEAGETVSSTALGDARKQLYSLQDYISRQNGPQWESVKPGLNAEIQRISAILETSGTGNTRIGKRTNQQIGSAAAAVTSAVGIAAKAPRGPSSNPTPAAPARYAFDDITTSQAEIDSFANKLAVLGVDPVNTNQVMSTIQGVFFGANGKTSAYEYNQSMTRQDDFNNRVRRSIGFDPSNPDAVVGTQSGWEKAVTGISREREKAGEYIDFVESAIETTKKAFTDKGLKFEDDENARNFVGRMNAVLQNLKAAYTVGGPIAQVEHELAMGRATFVANNMDKNMQIANTREIVERELDANTLSIPAGMSREDFINQETLDRVNNPSHSGAKGLGLTADQRQSVINDEYQHAMNQIKSGKPVLTGFFESLKAFAAEIKKSTEGWVKTLSAEGQSTADKFVKSMKNAADQIDAYADMTPADKQDAKKAAKAFEDLTKTRGELAKEIQTIESDPTRNTEADKRQVVQAKAALKTIDSIVGASGEGSLSKIAEKELGKNRIETMLDDAGVEREGGSSGSRAKKSPLFSLLGAHAAYQVFMAAKTGIDPFIQAVAEYDQGRLKTDSILSASGLAGTRADTLSGVGAEARASAMFRRGRESSRLGGLGAGLEESGLFNMARDMFDPARGAAIALVPFNDMIDQAAAASRDSGGRMAKLLEWGQGTQAKYRMAAEAARAAGTSVSMGQRAMGALGGLAATIASGPALPIILGGMAVAAIGSAVSHTIAAGKDEEGMAMVHELALRRGSSVASDASPWSYVAKVVGNTGYRAGTENDLTTGYGAVADTYRRAAIAADKMGFNRVNSGVPSISLQGARETRAFLEYSALGGDWRQYAKALGIDSGSQQEAQAIAISALGGVTTGNEFDQVNKRLLRAQASGEGAANAMNNFSAMAKAAGFVGVHEGARRYATLNDVTGSLSDEEKQKLAEYEQEKANVYSFKNVFKTGAKTMYEDPVFVGSTPTLNFGRAQANLSYQMSSIDERIDEIKLKNKYDDAQAKTYLSNYEKTGSGEDLDKAAVQAGLAKEGEVRDRLHSIQEKLALSKRALTSREGELIASSVIGSRLFQQTLVGMNYGQQNLDALYARLGPKDSAVIEGDTYSALVPSQKEVSVQLASYAESIRNMRMQAGLPYAENAGVYGAGVKFITDPAGRAIALDRNSVDQNTYQKFQKDQINRLLDQYGISDLNMFKSNKEFLKYMGWENNRVAQMQPVQEGAAADQIPSTVNASKPTETPAPLVTPVPAPRPKGKGSAGVYSLARFSPPQPTPESAQEQSEPGADGDNIGFSAPSSNVSKVPYVSQISNGWKSQCGPASFAMLTGVISPELGTHAGMQRIAIEDGNIVANSDGKYVETKGLDQYSSFSSLMNIAKKWDVPVKLESVPFLDKYKKGSDGQPVQITEEEKNAKPENAKSYPYIALVDNNSLPKKWERNKTNINHFIVVTSPTTYNDPAWPDKTRGENIEITPEQLEKAEHAAWAKYGNEPRQRIYLDKNDKRLSIFQDALYAENNKSEIDFPFSPVPPAEISTSQKSSSISSTTPYSQNISGIPLKEIPFYIKKIEDSKVSSSPALPSETPAAPTATRINPTATVSASSTATPVPPTATIAATKTSTATATAVPPTATILPTETAVPPTATIAATATATAVPPTATILPTETPIPPTATISATKTAVLPTFTPVFASPTPTSTLNAKATSNDFVTEMASTATARAIATKNAKIKTDLNSLRGIPLDEGMINLAYPSLGVKPGEIPYLLRDPNAPDPTATYVSTLGVVHTPVSTATAVPPTKTAVPTATEKPIWAAPYTPTAIPSKTPTATPTPKDFSLLSSGFLVAQTYGPAAPTATPASADFTALTKRFLGLQPLGPSMPTATPVPPTATPVPSTATPVPSTATPVPPTATAVPPTATATQTSTVSSSVHSSYASPLASPLISPLTSPLSSPTASIPSTATVSSTQQYASYAPLATSGNQGQQAQQKDEELSPVEQTVYSEVSQTLARMRLSDVIGGEEQRDYSSFANRLYKKDRYGMPVPDPFVAANIDMRNQISASGGYQILGALGIDRSVVDSVMTSPNSAVFMQNLQGFAAGDPGAITRMLRPEAMQMMDQITGGQFSKQAQARGLRPMIDPITGGGLFERSMGGMANPFQRGSFLTNQSDITPSAVKALFDPMRKSLFGNTQAQLNGAAYDHLNKVLAGDVYQYTDPVSDSVVKLGGLAGLQMESNAASYRATMASIGIQREQLEYNRERQLAWDFPVAATQNEVATAQMLGGVVHTQWMKDQGIGPLDFSGGTVKIDGMDKAVTYEGGQIGQQKFNLAMSKIEAKRGYEQNMARMGWQQADLFREISRSRIRGDWQRADFALQEEQMQFGREKQSYDFSYQAREMGISRQQYREDYAYGRRMREMQFGWQMEDSDIGIRRSTGFERKQLIKNKERETVVFNAETEQNERVNKRQEEAFKREEERFNKEIEHYKKSLAFEDEQFKRQQKRFEQQRDWEEEDYVIKSGRVAEEASWAAESYQRQLARLAVEEDILTKQEGNEKVMRDWRDRQHVEDMERAQRLYELSKKSLDASAAAAAEQKRIADQQVIINQQQADVANAWSRLLNEVNWEKLLREIREFVDQMGKSGYLNPKPAETDRKNEENKSRGRAFGGKVSRGESYVVGELGAEILNIGKDGTPYILPNSAIPKDRSIGRAGQGEVIHIHVMMDSNEIATYTSDKANGLASRNKRRAFNG